MSGIENEYGNEYGNELREVLDAAIGEEPPVGGGPAAVFAGARAQRARTRMVTGGLSMVAVLGIAAGAVAFGGGPGRTGQAISASTLAKSAPPVPTTTGAQGTTATTATTATAATAARAATPVATSSNVPAATTPPNTTTPTPLAQIDGPGTEMTSETPAPQPGAGQVLLDGRSVAETVKQVLGPGFVTANYEGQDSYQPEKGGVMTSGSMSVDDGSGKLTTVAAVLSQNNPKGQKVTDCTTEQQLFTGLISDCQAVAQPDGSVVMSFRRDDHHPGSDGATKGCYSYVATRVYQNGWVVTAEANNYFDPLNDPHKQGWSVSPSRPNPLVPMDVVVAIVVNPQWGLTVSADFAQHARQDLVPYLDRTQHG